MNQKVELEKARNELAELQKAAAQAVVKARSEVLKGVLKEDATVETVMKAVGDINAEAFDALVGVFKTQAAVMEKSDLFKEHGVTVDDADTAKPNALREALKAKYKN